MKTSILHIAPRNTAGVPWTIVKEERRRGFDSWLLTFRPHPFGFGQDETLNLPFIDDPLTTTVQRLLSTTPKKINIRREYSELPPKWQGNKFPTSLLFAMRDRIWKSKLKQAGFPKRLADFDIIVLDGGLPLLRNGKWISTWAKATGKLATVYYGTDLRQHGVIDEIDRLSDAVFVLEFDHIALHPRAKWLPFPFDADSVPPADLPTSGPIRIGHVASNRATKSTDAIIAAIEAVSERFDVEPVIIENVPHNETLRLKSTCHIFVDQLGELGYGISGLESLAMGIPTIIELLPDHEDFIGEHPFITADDDSLSYILQELILDEPKRLEIASAGKKWVREFHRPSRAVDVMHERYSELKWL
jgi:hypothetical protein